MPKINVNPSKALDEFIEQMMQAKGALTDNAEQNTKTKNQLRDQFNETIDRAMIDAVPEEKYSELDALLNREASDAEIEQFLANSGADFEQSVQAAMEKFRADYLADTPQANTMMTNTKNNTAAATASAGSPAQGTVSEVPGASNVEGAAQTVNTEENA